MPGLESEYVPIALDRVDIRTLIGWWLDAHPDGGAWYDQELATRLSKAML